MNRYSRSALFQIGGMRKILVACLLLLLLLTGCRTCERTLRVLSEGLEVSRSLDQVLRVAEGQVQLYCPPEGRDSSQRACEQAKAQVREYATRLHQAQQVICGATATYHALCTEGCENVYGDYMETDPECLEWPKYCRSDTLPSTPKRLEKKLEGLGL